MPIGLVDDMDLFRLSEMTFLTFNMHCQIIDPELQQGDLCQRFSNCVENIKKEFQYPQYYNGLMGLLLLFNNDETYELKDHRCIERIFQETKELVMTGYENFDDFDIDSLHRLISILGEMCDIFRIIFGSEPLARFKIDLTEINETDCFKDVNGLKTQIKAIDLSKPNTQEDRPTKLTNFYFQVPSNHKLDYHRHTLYSFQNFEKAFSSVTSGFLLTTTIGKICLLW